MSTRSDSAREHQAVTKYGWAQQHAASPHISILDSWDYEKEAQSGGCEHQEHYVSLISLFAPTALHLACVMKAREVSRVREGLHLASDQKNGTDQMITAESPEPYKVAITLQNMLSGQDAKHLTDIV